MRSTRGTPGLALALTIAVAVPAAAAEGVASDSPLMHPGKADFHAQATDDTDEQILFWWSPFFKGGGGTLDNGTERTDFLGGYLRPLAGRSQWGELILGFLSVDSGGERVDELQAEYRLPSGLGFGGGTADRGPGGRKVDFAKLTYRDRFGSLSTIVEVQAQEVGGETDPGGYLALYNDDLMFVYGSDQEQWRACFGLAQSAEGGRLRTAVEVLFVDNTIGRFPGTEFLFVNGTFGYRGGFLSHAARLGRAMGPTGLEFGNPLGFLAPTWNRRLDVWELGRMIDFRAVRTKFPNGRRDEAYEAVVFPFELDPAPGWTDDLFVGLGYSETAGVEADNLLGGFRGKVGFLELAVEVSYDLEGSEATVVVGLIDWF
jgi:hypothetical protein